MFPVRHGLTVGSAEFEKVMQCFKIEKKVDETKNSTTKRHKFQGQEDDEIGVSIDVEQRDAEKTTDDLNTTFKSLSLENDGVSTVTKTPAPRNWSYSAAITSSEKLRKTEVRFRRNSTPISGKKSFPSSSERFGHDIVQRQRLPQYVIDELAYPAYTGVILGLLCRQEIRQRK